jgi:hypothetical protein
MRFVSRYTLLKEFQHHAVSYGAKLTVAEVAFGDRPFEVQAHPQAYQLLQMRTNHELWLKESAINVAVSKLPADWKYVAWIDGDVAFVNPDWVQETIQQLQHHPIVQMFHTAIDMSPDHRPIGTFKGFPASIAEHGFISADKREQAAYYVGDQREGGLYHPGYAWACRRDAWDAMGGLLDINMVGGADLQMAYGLYGACDTAVFDGASLGYRKAVLDWQEHTQALKRNVGWVPGTLLHHWHGSKVNRRYFDRWQVLRDSEFDPYTDLKRDWQGLWQLAGNKIGLRDDLMRYFRQRNEDSIDCAA